MGENKSTLRQKYYYTYVFAAEQVIIIKTAWQTVGYFNSLQLNNSDLSISLKNNKTYS